MNGEDGSDTGDDSDEADCVTSSREMAGAVCWTPSIDSGSSMNGEDGTDITDGGGGLKRAG